MKKLNNISQSKKYLLLSILLFGILHLLTPVRGHNWDLYCWSEWAKYIYSNGLGNVYKFWTDYLPLYHYFLWLFGLFQNDTEKFMDHIHYMKMVPLFFQFVSGYFVLLLIQKGLVMKNAVLKSLFYVLNIAVLYNGLVWGQMDIVLTCFVLLSYYYALEHKVTLSLLFFLIAINFKLQAIIFIPPLALMLLPGMIKSFSLRELAKWVLVPLVFQLLVILPFYYAGTLELMWKVVLDSFHKHESVSIDAYNIWHLIFPNLTVYEVDTVRGFLLTHKQWGLLFFFVTSFFALFPFFRVLYKTFRTSQTHELPLNKSLLIFALIPLLFFYCNTEMHERYAHPGLIFIIIYCIRTGRPLLAFTASWAYFFNLERVLHFLQLPNYGTLIFEPIFISLIWLITIVGLFMNLYDIGPAFSLYKKYDKRLIHSSPDI